MRRGYRRPFRPFRRAPRSREFSPSLDQENFASEFVEDNLSCKKLDTGSKLILPNQQDCPYEFWSKYFPTLKYDKKSTITDLIKSSIDFIEKECMKSLEFSILSELTQTPISIDYESLIECEYFDKYNLKSLFLVNIDSENNGIVANLVLKAIALAFHFIASKNSEVGQDVIFIPRIINHKPYVKIRQLRAKHIGKFVTISATITRLGSIEQICQKIGFQCNTCGQVSVYLLNSLGDYEVPKSCPVQKCNGKNLTPVLNSKYTKIIDSQMILVQDRNDEKSSDNGCEDSDTWKLEMGGQSNQNFHTLHCQITETMVDKCLPGDVVILSGIFSCFMATSNNYFAHDAISNQKGSVYTLFLEVNNLERFSNKLFGVGDSQNKENQSENTQKGFKLTSSLRKELEIASSENFTQNNMDEPSKSDIDFTIRDLYSIREIYLKPDIFEILVSSFCPSITGRRKIKAGILLTLLGGTSKEENLSSFDRIGLKGHSSSKIRTQSHLMLIGDPGLGKSQILKAALAIAPRGIYVCGNTCTTAGLTIGLNRTDQNSSNTTSSAFGIEAGAVVLADQGVCFIDEFDKLACNSQCLLEAMEQQSVSISKGGVVATLPARTSIIVAANPSNGKYDPGKTLHENLKISHALLSRFDLVFLLRDTMDADVDRLMTSQMLANADRTVLNESSMNNLMANNTQQSSLINAKQIKKYILYARKYVNPCLTPEAGNYIKQHYLEMRERRSKSDLPVTFRYLESIVRLSESKAKAELRQEVTKEDAEYVCQLVAESYSINEENNNGPNSLLSNVNMVCGKPRKGTSATGNSVAKRLLVGLQTYTQRITDKTLSFNDIKEVAKTIGLRLGSDTNVQILIDKLNDNGFIVSKGNNTYKLI